MTGIQLTVELSQEEGRAALRALIDRMEDKLPFFRAVGERMMVSTKDNFAKQAGPDGTAWKKLSRSRVKQREAQKLTPIHILRARGYLAGSINYDASPDKVEIGSPVEYAGIHQLGGVIQQAARAAKIYRKREEGGGIGRRFVKKADADVVTDVTIPARAIRIPARPFLGISAADEVGMMEDAEDWLMR